MRQKIYVINKTSEPTGMLRKIVKIVADHKGISGNIKIRFINAKSLSPHGTAYIGKVYHVGSDQKAKNLGYHHNVTKMSLPANWKGDGLFRTLQVMEHEFDHTLGLRHKEMIDLTKIDVSDYLGKVQTCILNEGWNEGGSYDE